jgi:DNA-binding XRE family transcriptional regulator
MFSCCVFGSSGCSHFASKLIGSLKEHIPFWDYPELGLSGVPSIRGCFLPKAPYSERHRRLREILAQLRKDCGMTQAELSAAIRRPQSFVAKIERGERRLDTVELFDLVRAMKQDPFEALRRWEESSG